MNKLIKPIRRISSSGVKSYIPYIIILVILLIILIIFYIKSNEARMVESFKNDKNYLYPIKGLSSICAKNNLKPSYMPKACYIDGNLNSYANCKCEDKEGNCKICYDTIKKDSKNSSVIYNANASE